jgi:hypothetical protein
MERKLSKNTAYAPSNEIHGGVISYPNEGRFTDYSRRDAYKKMYAYCGGEYRIIEEGEHLGGGGAIPIGNIVTYDQQRKWMIKFECAH